MGLFSPGSYHTSEAILYLPWSNYNGLRDASEGSAGKVRRLYDNEGSAGKVRRLYDNEGSAGKVRRLYDNQRWAVM